MKAEYDYIVIGAGSTGCVIAHRLTADPDTTVLLIEAGGRDTHPSISQPPAWPTLIGSEIDWKYQTEPEPFLHQARVPTPRGKVLGGTSSINAMVYLRGNRTDYDGWRALGNPGWGYEDVLPLFKRSEDNQRGADEFHGVGGPLHVSDPADPSPGSLAFLRAAEALGFPLNPDFNGPRQEGAGLYQLTQRNGQRQSAAIAFLHPILDRPNLTVEVAGLVTRILIERGRAVGVSWVVQGKAQETRARREVILSAGAINSPQLLLLSGIGPGDDLRRLGVPVSADLKGVGKNLQDHPLVKVVFRARQPFPLAATSNLAEAGLFLHTGVEPAESAPDVQFHFGPILLPDPRLACEGPGYTFGANVARPLSRGTVRLRSADPGAAPVIQANYLQERTDRKRLVEAVKIARALGSHPAFEGVRESMAAPGREVQSEAELEEFVRRMGETVWHPVGTCKMGHDAEAVVGADLRVHGVEGLRVADASVMPAIPTGNTNGPCIMIGEKASEVIRGG
jgi:choline dehydrogenase